VVAVPSFNGDVWLTVVGNDTLSLHFETGIRLTQTGRVLDSSSSTAPFIDFFITGYLTKQLKGF
jgi:hypothetical protein